MSMREISCVRCHVPMVRIMREKLQLGQTGWLLGDWPNLLAGSLEVDIHACPQCGKLEFFLPEETDQTNKMAQQRCPSCGHWHDMDDPKCPLCRHDYIQR